MLQEILRTFECAVYGVAELIARVNRWGDGVSHEDALASPRSLVGTSSVAGPRALMAPTSHQRAG